MDRRNFLKCSNLCGAGLLGLGSVASMQAADFSGDDASKKQTPLTLRPYQLLCTICSLGEEGNKPVKQYEKCKQIRDAVHQNPNMPITLACHAGALYDYQEPETKRTLPRARNSTENAISTSCKFST